MCAMLMAIESHRVFLMAWTLTLQVLAASPNNGSPQQQQQARHLSIHEHEAMDLLQKYKISVPKYNVAHTAEDAFKIAKEYGKLLYR